MSKPAPIVSFARALRDQHDGAAALLMGLILVYALAAISCGFSTDAARFFMKRFQLRTENFAAWAMFQPMPWMYNFENRYWVSRLPLTAADFEMPPAGVVRRQINHQVARAITFGDVRLALLRDPGEHFFYLESRYRDAVVRTSYVVTVASDCKAGSCSAQLRRLGTADE